MTAPTELLKLTPAELEEAAAAVEDLYRWNEVPTPPLVGKLRRLAQGAAEDAEPAAARYDAAELRAVVRLSVRLLEWLSSRKSTAPADAHEAEEIVRRARAALAATEGSESC